jgi:hypothetical protein
MPRDRYLAFAEWRLGVQRARDRRKSVKYFRLTTHHLIIWTVIMRGYYAGRPPSLNDCLRSVTCAAETARSFVRRTPKAIWNFATRLRINARN